MGRLSSLEATNAKILAALERSEASMASAEASRAAREASRASRRHQARAGGSAARLAAAQRDRVELREEGAIAGPHSSPYAA